MDLPSKSTWDEVRAAVRIETQGDVRAINTVALARTIMKAFVRRDLAFHREHPKDLEVIVRNEHYSGVEDYQNAIAAHLKIDMTADPKRKRAMDLLPDIDGEPSFKRIKTDNDGTAK